MKDKAISILCGVFCLGVLALGLTWYYRDSENGFRVVEVETVFQKEYPEGYETPLVDLNTATKEKLMTLPYVGEVTAEKIIAYREKNGGFLAIEELMEVSGIGEIYFAEMKEFLVLSERELIKTTP